MSSTLLTAYAMRWLSVLGLGSGVVLLFGAGAVPWLELRFPTWVFVLSVHILVVSFRSTGSERVVLTE